MHELSSTDLREAVETVWTVTLRLAVLDPAGSLPPPPELTWCGCVHITGAWSGLVKVQMSEALTRKAAAAMFEAEPDSLSAADMTDALGEIANMTGGSVKALLPGPSQLSLPSVVTGADYAMTSPGSSVLREVAFQTGGSQIRVQVLQQTERGGPEGSNRLSA